MSSSTRQQPSVNCAITVVASLAVLGLLLLATGCTTATMGANRAAPRVVFQQVHGNMLSSGEPSSETRAVLHRFDQEKQFKNAPDETLKLLHRKAVESGEHELLYALSELNFIEGERLRRTIKPWEPRDARDYYLASAVYAWFFLLGDANSQLPPGFDDRFRAACNFYNAGLGWALTGRRATNAVALLQGGTRHLPVGEMEVQFSQPGFPWPLTVVKNFILADQYLVRGLSVRNVQPGLGVPLIAVAKSTDKIKFSRCTAATAFLRIEGKLADLDRNRCRASLELYSVYVTNTVQVAGRPVPLETDTTAPIAYTLNQTFVWSLGNAQFLSAEERIPSGIYITRPYQPGRVPVVFVHGTFSSPIWWAEMMNTLSADPVLRERCQFWYFIYNSGNPLAYSANRLREALAAKVKELDPEGRDPAIQQMVVVGHSQGGLLTKLTATETGDQLWRVVNTNRLETVDLTEAQQALIRKFLYYHPLPFVKRVVFISTPHRGSYLASNFVRGLARRLVTLPKQILDQSREVIGLREKLGMPGELKGMPTSLDSMRSDNPYLLALADIPTAPGVKAHSIIAVQGEGDYHQGKDGLVKYSSAHVGYAESEFIVRSFHSCQDKPAAIEEVRRILHEHLDSLRAASVLQPAPAMAPSSP
jgi:pimeloyl-ACP methyl ester carboxylesterase